MNIHNRYFITLIFTILRAGFNFIVSIYIARYLMPEVYGNYQYIVSVVTALLVYANIGTDKAYFTFISQHKQTIQFHLIYLLWQFLQIFAILSLVSLLNENIYHLILQHIDKRLMIVAIVALFLSSSIQTMITYLFESVRKTYYAQSISLLIACIHLIIILFFIKEHILTIELIFYVIIAEYCVYVVLALFLMLKIKESLFLVTNNNAFEFKKNCIAYYNYSKPLIALMIVSFFYILFDRWLIQKYVGPHGQAFFSISVQFSTLSILISSSILKIFWKEVAEAFKEENIEKIRKYFTLISNDIFIFTSVISISLFYFSSEIIHFVYGDAYKDSLLVFQLIMLYTIPQSLGQLYSTYYLATSKMHFFTKVSLIFMLFGIPLGFFFLSDMGLALDESGIALKMLLDSILSSMILGYFISKDLEIPMYIYKKLQILAVCFIVTFSFYTVLTYIYTNFIYQAISLLFFYILPISIYLFIKLKKEL